MQSVIDGHRRNKGELKRALLLRVLREERVSARVSIAGAIEDLPEIRREVS